MLTSEKRSKARQKTDITSKQEECHSRAGTDNES